MRVLAGAVGIVLAVIALGFLAQRIFGGDSISLAEAREAIEEMPYKVAVAERPDDALIGSARAPHGVIVHFAVSDSIDGRGIPARLRRLTHEPSGGGGFWVWDDSEFWFRGTGPVRLARSCRDRRGYRGGPLP